MDKQADKKDFSTKKGAPQTGCSHCGGPHYLSSCPTATKEDRDLLEVKQSKKGVKTPARRHR
ncbi:hypothetical protein GN244_ATG02211 [Phytophthora infestans]|uniref:Uncharacterized protein n=1 Tax=Phytophthora infestans TaxID=4787 RepID=A0A833ST20_PHYIN|nr:hypothetical protein GN244_ATG02211 [Phytophthora infestans]